MLLSIEGPITVTLSMIFPQFQFHQTLILHKNNQSRLPNKKNTKKTKSKRFPVQRTITLSQVPTSLWFPSAAELTFSNLNEFCPLKTKKSSTSLTGYLSVRLQFKHWKKQYAPSWIPSAAKCTSEWRKQPTKSTDTFWEITWLKTTKKKCSKHSGRSASVFTPIALKASKLSSFQSEKTPFPISISNNIQNATITTFLGCRWTSENALICLQDTSSGSEWLRVTMNLFTATFKLNTSWTRTPPPMSLFPSGPKIKSWLKKFPKKSSKSSRLNSFLKRINLSLKSTKDHVWNQKWAIRGTSLNNFNTWSTSRKLRLFFISTGQNFSNDESPLHQGPTNQFTMTRPVCQCRENNKPSKLPTARLRLSLKWS